jgi:hypothetical protein
MASLIWAICCQRAIVDRETNGLSLIDHLEGLTLPTLPPRRDDGALPLVPVRFAVTSHWIRSDETVPELFDLRVRLVDPAGVSHAEGKAVIDLQSAATSRNIVSFPGLPVTGAGTYTIELARKLGDDWAIEPASPKIRVVVAASAVAESKVPPPRAATSAKRSRKK